MVYEAEDVGHVRMEKVLIIFALNPLKAPARPSVLRIRESNESICHRRRRRSKLLGSDCGFLRASWRVRGLSPASTGWRAEGGSAWRRVFTVSKG